MLKKPKSFFAHQPTNPKAKDFRAGQAMIITVVALGGTMLGATTIAGLLMVYQIRQSTDMANSTKAVYAADAGIEWQLHNYFVDPDIAAPSFSDGRSSVATDMTCYQEGSVVSCSNNPVDVDSIEVRSVGKNGAVSRAFKVNF